MRLYILGKGNLYLMVIFLITHESMHIHHSPLIFSLNNIGIAQGLKFPISVLYQATHAPAYSLLHSLLESSGKGIYLEN
jgi:hypothetical protein